MKNQLIVALSYTKQRTMFGMVGIEIDPSKRIAFVRLAKQWRRDDMNSIPGDIAQIYSKVKWDMTFADQLVGQHLLRSVESSIQTQVQTITTQKNLKDPEDIEAMKVMDMTEMTQLTLSLKQEHKIQFPPNNLSDDMIHLIKQMEMFTEHTTEQGTISYYAPGDELDCLPRALMICCFVGRMSLQHGEMPMIIKRGSENLTPDTRDNIDTWINDTFGGNESLSDYSMNRMSRKRMYETKKFF